MFLLDGSASIEDTAAGGTRGNFKSHIVTFAKAIIQDRFDVGLGARQTRVAVATFSSANARPGAFKKGASARVDFNFDDHATAAEMTAALDTIKYPKGGTYTSIGTAPFPPAISYFIATFPFI